MFIDKTDKLIRLFPCFELKTAIIDFSKKIIPYKHFNLRSLFMSHKALTNDVKKASLPPAMPLFLVSLIPCRHDGHNDFHKTIFQDCIKQQPEIV